MKKETLSDKAFVMEGWNHVLSIPDVKQFIKEILEEIESWEDEKGLPMDYNIRVFLKKIIKQKAGKELLK